MSLKVSGAVVRKLFNHVEVRVTEGLEEFTLEEAGAYPYFRHHLDIPISLCWAYWNEYAFFELLYRISGEKSRLLRNAWYYNLSDNQRDSFGQTAKWLPHPDLDAVRDETNFSELYGMINIREDWATLYQAWVSDFEGLDRKSKKSPLLAAKASQMASIVFHATAPNGQRIVIMYPEGIPI